MNVHGITGAAIVKLPAFKRLSLFVLGGGAAMFFDRPGYLLQGSRLEVLCLRRWC